MEQMVIASVGGKIANGKRTLQKCILESYPSFTQPTNHVVKIYVHTYISL